MILNNREFSPAECRDTIEIVEIPNDNPNAQHNTTPYAKEVTVTLALPLCYTKFPSLKVVVYSRSNGSLKQHLHIYYPDIII